MTLHLKSSVAAHLDNAYRTVEKAVLRSKSGTVYAIEIGETLVPSARRYAARVSRESPSPLHMGTCQGESVEGVFRMAQDLLEKSVGAEAVREAGQEAG